MTEEAPLKGSAARAVLEERMTEACGFADSLFEGSNVRFVFVVWPEGFETDQRSFAVFAPPKAQPVTITALRTAADALENRP